MAPNSFLEEYLFTGEDVSIEQVRTYLPQCFGTFCSYSIKEQIPTTKSEIQQFIIKVLFEHELQAPALSALHFNRDTVSAYEKVLNNPCKHIPIEDVFLSCLERKYKFCYLDLFRCIERLFKVSMTHDFKKTLQCTVQTTKIAEFVYQYAGKGHQENQIKYLFTLLPEDVTNIVKKAFTEDINVGTIFYKTRNDIVHYQTSESSYENYTDAQWNAWVQFCLLAMDILYTEFDNYLSEIPNT